MGSCSDADIGTALVRLAQALVDASEREERLRESLGIMLSMANVPERDQGDAWNDEYARIAKICYPMTVDAARGRESKP